MQHVRGLFKKFRNSDGRIKIRTLSGVTATAIAVALLVGMLPAGAGHTTSKITPIPNNYGGGPGACASSVDALPSAAGNELHINNPMPGLNQTFTGPDGTVFTIDVYTTSTAPAGTLFAFTVVDPGVVVFDVVVNGGPKNLHYNYAAQIGPVTSDRDLHAPKKNNRSLHNLSHINICYDAQQFFCDGTVTSAIRLNDGIIVEATTFLLSNSEYPTCVDKEGVFVIDHNTSPPSVTLDYGDTGGTVIGRLDVYKDFGLSFTTYDDLEYDGGPIAPTREDVPWCDIRTPKATGDGGEFDDVLASNQYPNMPTGHTACKVYEGENAAGFQWNVVYYEFKDPRFY